MKHLGKTMLVSVAWLAASSAQATWFSNSTGLASPQQTITFESVSLGANNPVTTEFALLGVTFSTAFANPDPSETYPHITGNRIGNFRSNGNRGDLLTARFSSNLSQVAFALVSAPGTATVTAWLNDSLVESATLPSSAANVNNVFGFQDLVFNKVTIRVASYDSALLIDNLQTVTAVPEPASWALLLAGAACVGTVVRRRGLRRHSGAPALASAGQCRRRLTGPGGPLQWFARR